jgi:hypothetical protein
MSKRSIRKPLNVKAKSGIDSYYPKLTLAQAENGLFSIAYDSAGCRRLVETYRGPLRFGASAHYEVIYILKASLSVQTRKARISIRCSVYIPFVA